jgi:hypothetical protein
VSERPRSSISTLRGHSYAVSYDAKTRVVSSRLWDHIARLRLQWDLVEAQFRVLTSLRSSELDTCGVRLSASNSLSRWLRVILCCFRVIRNGNDLCEVCLWTILGILFACWLCCVFVFLVLILLVYIKWVSTLRNIRKSWMYKYCNTESSRPGKKSQFP